MDAINQVTVEEIERNTSENVVRGPNHFKYFTKRKSGLDHIPPGMLLVHYTPEGVSFFQARYTIKVTTSLSNADRVYAEPGSQVGKEKYFFDSYRMSACRFPTIKELGIYARSRTV